MPVFSSRHRNRISPLTLSALILVVVCSTAVPVSGALRTYGGLGPTFADGHGLNRLGTGLSAGIGVGYEFSSGIELDVRGTYMWFIKSRINSDYNIPTRNALSGVIDLKINLTVDRNRTRAYLLGSWGAVTLDRGSNKPDSPLGGGGFGIEFPTRGELVVFVEARYMTTIGKGVMKDTNFAFVTIGVTK